MKMQGPDLGIFWMSVVLISRKKMCVIVLKTTRKPVYMIDAAGGLNKSVILKKGFQVKKEKP